MPSDTQMSKEPGRLLGLAWRFGELLTDKKIIRFIRLVFLGLPYPFTSHMVTQYKCNVFYNNFGSRGSRWNVGWVLFLWNGLGRHFPTSWLMAPSFVSTSISRWSFSYLGLCSNLSLISLLRIPVTTFKDNLKFREIFHDVYKVLPFFSPDKCIII